MTVLLLGRSLFLSAGLIALMSLTGCGADIALNIAQPVQVTSPDGLSGQVRNGLRSIANAQIQLYSAGTTGIASEAKSLLTTQVVSDESGNFSLASDFTCSAGQQLYIVAIGGKTDKGTNPSTALMAALGDCAGINSSSFAIVNEVTTVASVFALAPFMKSYGNVGAPSGNAKGIASAFATVAKLASIEKGSAIGPALPQGATIDSSKLNSLANIVAQCVHSAGGSSGDGSACGQMFALVTAGGAAGPTDTIAFTLDVATSPANAAAAIFKFGQTDTPFAPYLAVAPDDWALAITYRSGGFNTPSSTSIDKDGNIWVANAGNNTVSVLSQSGLPAFDLLSGNSLNRPVAIAIDTNGEAWVVNHGGASVSIFQADGSVGPTPNVIVGSQPIAAAVDPTGLIWVANLGSNSLTELSLTGTVIRTVSSQVNQPSGIAINMK